MPRKKLKIVEKNLNREKANGQYWVDDNLIEIHKDLKNEEKFITLCHEMLHKVYPKMGEKEVLRGEEIGRELWKFVIQLLTNK